ncbi:copper chaperone PCu(A)C [Mumia quercus]|uniref:copper chaperone PCu(A)C n=1 Tax=Mumia quercus TaxID=2976125 RepID=UPI0021CF88C2|nr:copper chaperone PCu(A)C [Mumia quercus]
MKATRFRTPRRILVAATALLTLSALAACGSDESADADAPRTQADAVTVSEPWIKAADKGMTGGFAQLANKGDEDVTVVSASSAAAQSVELHEMAKDPDTGAMVMQEREDGLPIAGGSTAELAPGGDHLMFIGLTGPLAAGQEVEVTLTFADDSELTFSAPARSFSGAEEEYDPHAGGHDG